MQILRLACRWLCMSNYSVENIPRGVLRKLVHRILSNYHIDLSEFFICCVVVSRLAYEEIILRQYSRNLIFDVLGSQPLGNSARNHANA